MRTVRDLAWLAGLFEGEGSITTATKRNPLRLSMKSTDEDVLRRAHAIAGIGTLNGPYAPAEKNLGKKPYWTWSVHRSAEAAGLLMTMYPLLGVRRQERASSALAAWRERPPRYRKPKRDPGLCKKQLHPKSEPGCCPECKRISNARWRAERRAA